MELHRERRGRILIGYDLNVCGSTIPVFGGLQRLIKFAACGDTNCEPSFASKCMRKLAIELSGRPWNNTALWAE
jgi:hypothetical protein